jgi:hypothetical protein
VKSLTKIKKEHFFSNDDGAYFQQQFSNFLMTIIVCYVEGRIFCYMLCTGENILLRNKLLHPRRWQVINELFPYDQLLKLCKVAPSINKKTKQKLKTCFTNLNNNEFDPFTVIFRTSCKSSLRSLKSLSIKSVLPSMHALNNPLNVSTLQVSLVNWAVFKAEAHSMRLPLTAKSDGENSRPSLTSIRAS